MRGRRSALRIPIALAATALVLAQMRSVAAIVVPTFADLTIRTRHSFDGTSSRPTTEVLYLKGARERREFLYGQPGNIGARHVSIVQCDQRRTVELNPDAKLHSVSVLRDGAEQSKRRGTPLPEEPGADVTTTFDSIDTGERRQVGSYVARRVQTRVTVEPSAGANTPASTRETDGLYIHLPGLGCSDAETTSMLVVESIGPGGRRDRHHYQTKGAARRGYAIEETTRLTTTGGTSVHRVELIELSEHSLDVSLFEIPRDYRSALPLVRGGFDMTKPDTLTNRLQAYWGEITLAARTIFR
jgi:hypothetical protein